MQSLSAVFHVQQSTPPMSVGRITRISGQDIGLPRCVLSSAQLLAADPEFSNNRVGKGSKSACQAIPPDSLRTAWTSRTAAIAERQLFRAGTAGMLTTSQFPAAAMMCPSPTPIRRCLDRGSLAPFFASTRRSSRMVRRETTPIRLSGLRVRNEGSRGRDRFSMRVEDAGLQWRILPPVYSFLFGQNPRDRIRLKTSARHTFARSVARRRVRKPARTCDETSSDFHPAPAARGGFSGCIRSPMSGIC